MQFDDTPEVRLTEWIMARINKKFPRPLETAEYNRIFEAVLETLQAHGIRVDSELQDDLTKVKTRRMSFGAYLKKHT
jgi:hypothetical protein